MYLYVLPPIDLGWETLPSVAEVAADAAREDTRDLLARYEDAAEFDLDPSKGQDGQPNRFDGLLETLENAFGLALRHGWWASRFRHEARVLPIPDDGTFLRAVVWREDDTGLTFVASPIELPHLDKIALDKTYDREPLSC